MKRGWWLIPLVLVITLSAARFLTERVEPVYRATASVVVAPSDELKDTGEVLRAVDTLERRSLLATLAELTRSPRLKAEAAAAADWPEEALRRYDVSATVMPHANVLRVTVQGPDPVRVAELAQGLGTAITHETRRLYAPFRGEILAPAVAPRGAMLPDARRNYAVAAVLGVFLGVSLAFAFGRSLPPLPGLVRTAVLQARAAE
jgi:capsular polysaccharide biosynthesis protein